MAQLLDRYRPPLRSHLVSRKHIDPEQADELLQSFLLRQVLERELIGSADQQRGRFRTFLLTALDRFVFNELRNERVRQRRVGGSELLAEAEEVPEGAAQPDEVFDVAWARGVLAESLRRMREECRGLGRPTIWGVFRARVLRPIFTARDPEPYAQVVERLGFASPTHASNALITSKRMFVRVLRAVVGEYERGEADVEAEIADLRRILSASRAGRPGRR